MNREEILEKSRKEMNDEGLIAAENKGRKIGIAAFTCIFALITLFDFFNGRVNYAANGLFWAFLAAEAYPKYKFTSKSGYLIMVIVGVLICIVSLASYVLTVLR